MTSFIIQLTEENFTDLVGLKVSDNTIFTVLFTILIFISGYLLNKLNEHRKEKVRLDDLKNYFYLLIELIIKPINDQINLLNELADDISDLEKTQYKFKENVNLDITNLKEISNNDLYKIFLIRKKGTMQEKTNHFTNITNTLNYIERLKLNSRLNYEGFNEEYNKNRINWANACNSILRQYDSFRSFNLRNNIELSADPFLKDFDLIIFYWNKRENSKELQTTYEYFINKLRDMCKKYEPDERANIILQLVLGADSSFHNIKVAKEIFSKGFKGDAIQLKSKLAGLEAAIVFFQR